MRSDLKGVHEVVPRSSLRDSTSTTDAAVTRDAVFFCCLPYGVRPRRVGGDQCATRLAHRSPVVQVVEVVCCIGSGL